MAAVVGPFDEKGQYPELLRQIEENIRGLNEVRDGLILDPSAEIPMARLNELATRVYALARFATNFTPSATWNLSATWLKVRAISNMPTGQEGASQLVERIQEVCQELLEVRRKAEIEHGKVASPEALLEIRAQLARAEQDYANLSQVVQTLTEKTDRNYTDLSGTIRRLTTRAEVLVGERRIRCAQQ